MGGASTGAGEYWGGGVHRASESSYGVGHRVRVRGRVRASEPSYGVGHGVRVRGRVRASEPSYGVGLVKLGLQLLPLVLQCRELQRCRRPPHMTCMGSA